jgi:uncharacterized membrane protein
MTELFFAALFLPISHFVPSSSALRSVLVARLGERGYLATYSLLTTAAFVWLVVAYRHAEPLLLWQTPRVLKLSILPIIFLAFVLAIVGVTTPNPSAIGAGSLLDRPGSARGILRITRNPFLWGVGLWALCHVVVSGDLAGLLLFGSIGSLGIGGSMLLDAKKARQYGDRWSRFAAETSNAPLAAILAGRQRFTVSEVPLWQYTLALVIFLVVLAAHRRMFGVVPIVW